MNTRTNKLMGLQAFVVEFGYYKAMQELQKRYDAATSIDDDAGIQWLAAHLAMDFCAEQGFVPEWFDLP